MQPLNSPIELGVRSLVLLSAVHPRTLDLSRLVLMDHCMLHSADLGGPDSILPAIPARSGEIAVKRSLIEQGVRVMMRAQMVEAFTTPEGLEYAAGEQASSFLHLLESPHLAQLTVTAGWVASQFGELDERQIRDRLGAVLDRWSQELDVHGIPEAVMASEG